MNHIWTPQLALVGNRGMQHKTSPSPMVCVALGEALIYSLPMALETWPGMKLRLQTKWLGAFMGHTQGEESK